VLTVVLGGIALLVGGIGIMNTGSWVDTRVNRANPAGSGRRGLRLSQWVLLPCPPCPSFRWVRYGGRRAGAAWFGGWLRRRLVRS
jgi:hypothetical protein